MCTIINVNRPFVYPQTIKTGANRGENWERKQSKRHSYSVWVKCPFTKELIHFVINSKKEEKELKEVIQSYKYENQMNNNFHYQMAA
jgi:hypothetical protein